MAQTSWTVDELRQELQRFEQEARRAGLRENSINTYVQRSGIFLRWLEGAYQFQGPPAVMDRTPEVKPIGRCYCGCGASTVGRTYFVPSHDRRAESRVIRERYGNIAAFVVAHGFGPDHPDGDGPTGRS